MAQSVFTLRGQVVTADGHPLKGVRLAICDRDTVADDLLGIGLTDGEGRFRLSFTRREFNQEPMENESAPDLYIVFSTWFDGVLRVLQSTDFADRDFVDGHLDLGRIQLRQWLFPPPQFARDEPTPGYRKRVHRLSIDDSLIEHCLEDVSPLVESLTGWRGLLDAPVVVVDNAVAMAQRAFASAVAAGTAPFTPLEAWASTVVNPGVVALYEPQSRRVLVERHVAEFQNLDALKIVLGHELVHVGQHKAQPGIYEACLAASRDVVARFASGHLDVDAFGSHEIHGLMAKIEGYAAYVQSFLQEHYNCATFFDHRSVATRLLQDLIAFVVPQYRAVIEMKAAQYGSTRRADEGPWQCSPFDDWLDRS